MVWAALIAGVFFLCVVVLIGTRHIRSLRDQVAAQRSALEQANRQREQLEESFRTQQDFLRNVIDTVPGFVCVKGLGGRFVLANRCLADAYGTTSTEIVGKIDAELNDDAAEVEAFVEDDRQVIVERKVKQIPAEKFTNSRGEERWLQTTKVPLVEKDGTCTQLLAVAIDITEQRRLEQELFQAQKMQAIGQLAGGVAHDFNNMLTGILGASELLRSLLPTRDTALIQCCELIESAAEQAAALTRQLLAFSRKGTMNVAPVHVEQVLTRVVQLLQRTLDRRIQIDVNVGPGQPIAIADAAFLQNALLNLGVNARDAMPYGGTLTFSAKTLRFSEEDCRDGGWDVRPGPHVEIAVADTGVGMDGPTKERIFEPFFTTKAPGQGTGLGLSAVYGTVVSHRGKIVIESQLGVGTTFRLYFPAGSCAPQVTRECHKANRGSGVILLVDDEPVVRTTAREILVDLGYEVKEAEDGVDAVRIFSNQDQRFDLVILDLIMPRMGGAAAFSKLRRLRQHVPILLASGFSVEGEVASLLSAGACGFLQKPYRRTELAQVVSSALAHARPVGLAAGA